MAKILTEGKIIILEHFYINKKYLLCEMLFSFYKMYSAAWMHVSY